MNNKPGYRVIGIMMSDKQILVIQEELRAFNKKYEMNINQNQFLLRIIQRYVNRLEPDPIGAMD